jgi:hypothetical protein
VKKLLRYLLISAPGNRPVPVRCFPLRLPIIQKIQLSFDMNYRIANDKYYYDYFKH